MASGWNDRVGVMLMMLVACAGPYAAESEEILERRSPEDLPGWITGNAPPADAVVMVDLPEGWHLLAGDPGPSPPGGPLNQSWTRFEPPLAPLVAIEANSDVERPDVRRSESSDVDFHGLDASTRTERDFAPDELVERTQLLVLVGDWVLQFEMTDNDDVDYLMAVAERVSFDS